MLGLQWILSIWEKKKCFSSLENILLDWYISLQIPFLMFAIFSGTPISQMQSSWIDPLSHSSFLYFLSLCPFAPWYEKFPFSYHPTLQLNVFKFCLSYIYFDFQEFFLFSDFLLFMTSSSCYIFLTDSDILIIVLYILCIGLFWKEGSFFIACLYLRMWQWRSWLWSLTTVMASF